MQESEARWQHEEAQHREEIQNQKKHIAVLSGMVNKEVQTYQEANAALKKATEEQTSMQEKVAALSVELKVALDQIHDLSVDLATTRSLLDAAPQQKPVEGQAGTSGAPQTSEGHKPLQVPLTTDQKGKKTPSRASSRKTPSRCPSLSLHGGSDIGADSSLSSQEETPKSWRFLRSRKGRS